MIMDLHVSHSFLFSFLKELNFFIGHAFFLNHRVYIYINKWILENSEEPNKFPRVTSIQ
jgi:hypothetical protein